MSNTDKGASFEDTLLSEIKGLREVVEDLRLSPPDEEKVYELNKTLKTLEQRVKTLESRDKYKYNKIKTMDKDIEDLKEMLNRYAEDLRHNTQLLQDIHVKMEVVDQINDIHTTLKTGIRFFTKTAKIIKWCITLVSVGTVLYLLLTSGGVITPALVTALGKMLAGL